MEPAKIDWKKIESIFEEDKLYENINAPKWFDFFAPDQSIDDEAWFCRPDCNHPKTAEDFLKFTPPTSKFSISAHKFRTPFSDLNRRDENMKRRWQNQISSDKAKFNEDGENRNPNLSSPSNYQTWKMKALVKSSSERKKSIGEVTQTNQAQPLRSTLSARNLFAGKDILSHISEFCTELKKMAMRTREKEHENNLNKMGSQMGERNVAEAENGGSREILGELDTKAKERGPFLEVRGEKSEGTEKGSAKEKQRRKKRLDDAENIPVPLNLANVKHKGEERLLQIRTNPPSPQCFSATRSPASTKTTTPLKGSKSRLMVRQDKGILQEVKQDNEMRKEEAENKSRNFSIVEGREARALDVFWFLKPCTLSS